MSRARLLLTGSMALSLAVAACGQSDSTSTVADSTTVPETTTSQATTESTVTDSADETAGAGTGIEPCDGCAAAVAADPAWPLHSNTWFAYDVPDRVPLFAAPDFAADQVAELTADAAGLQVYVTGDDSWVALATADDGVAWTPASFVRPEPAISPPTVDGTLDPAVEDSVADVLAALPDGPALADLVGADGLLLAFDDEASSSGTTVSQAELADPTAEARDFGPLGVGVTLDEALFELAGLTALTSTEQITVGDSDVAERLGLVSADSVIVEYSFGGTASADHTDWSAVGFVFDTGSGEPVLTALVGSRGSA